MLILTRFFQFSFESVFSLNFSFRFLCFVLSEIVCMKQLLLLAPW